MAIRFWTCHWQNRYWRGDVNREYEPVDHSAGNRFTKRGVASGDIVYIISLSKGKLLVGGRMTVDRILDQDQAVAHFGSPDFYEADEHLIGVEGSGTPLNLHRQLAPEITRQLRFQTKEGEKGPFFVSENELDNQATRGLRELTSESAELLDRIIEMTDRLPRTDDVIEVTEELLAERNS